MNKHEFLTTLKNNLASMPEAEKGEILYDYEEHFRIGQEDGKSEEEIAASLGDPRFIARQFKADFSINQAATNTSAGNIFKAVLATVGLGFFNLVFVFGPFMGLVGALIVFFAAALGVTVGGLGTLLVVFLAPAFPDFIAMDVSPVVAVFMSIGTTCLGLLMFIGCCYLAKFFYKGTVKYLKWNMDIITRK
ncbi:MAG: DUF1700 domain-containing protein [Clostridia bacterium]|nr:DUF1700 domain-containing protein [Clostridia bacterium]